MLLNIDNKIKTYDQSTIQRQLRLLAQVRHYTDLKKYEGELGAIYSSKQTIFRVWSANAAQIELLIYEDMYGSLSKSYLMHREDMIGVFEYILEGDHHLTTYNFRVTFTDGTQVISNDPYSRSATVNGHRSVVMDLNRTHPAEWSSHERMPNWEDWSKTIIYEANIRDLTMSKTANFQFPGKFKGVSERGRLNSYGSPVGIDYIKELGVTHVELLPFYDFYTIDETEYPPRTYNWGYDPYNYNVPEGSYSLNPFDPVARIKELKQMIQSLHEAGLRVIMDVVYNHVYEVENHSFHRTSPGYYFRYNDQGHLTNGTGVGNDTASERFMMQRYIVDSIKYWLTEFKLDGFRFDLMGIHDLETMKLVRETVDEIDPSIIIIGEGWNLNTQLSETERAIQKNAHQIPKIGMFNDGLREAIKGNDFDAEARGFVNGAWYMEEHLGNQMMANPTSLYYDNPLQVIQYVEAHDNYTLFDKLKSANPNIHEDTIIRQHMLATTITLLSQGIPFIHAGQEFMRTKHGVRDSYNQPDNINAIDWNRQETYHQSVRLVKRLIKLRQREPLLRLSTYKEIDEKMMIHRADSHHLQIEMIGDGYELYLLINGNEHPIDCHIPQGRYDVLIQNHQVNLNHPPQREINDKIKVDSLSVTLLRYYP